MIKEEYEDKLKPHSLLRQPRYDARWKLLTETWIQRLIKNIFLTAKTTAQGRRGEEGRTGRHEQNRKGEQNKKTKNNREKGRTVHKNREEGRT